MSATNSLHYDLCCKAAQWLKKTQEPLEGAWKYIAVDLNVIAAECPDVWAFNGALTCLIEVKTTKADFLADRKKIWRKDLTRQAGNFRYYLTPKGMLNLEDLSHGWGLLEWDGMEIVKKVPSARFPTIGQSDLIILNSLLVREGFKKGIYNYRYNQDK